LDALRSAGKKMNTVRIEVDTLESGESVLETVGKLLEADGGWEIGSSWSWWWGRKIGRM